MNLRKSIFLFTLIVFLTKTLSGQQENNLEVLYLKGGKFMFGNLIEEKEGSIIWQLTDGTKMTINEDKIRSIRNKKKNIQYLKKGKHKKTRGFYGSILAGSFWNTNPEANGQGTLHLSIGYHLNKRIAVGIGGGLDLYDKFHYIWPVFAEITGNIFDSSFLPYYKLTAGYSYLNQSAISDPSRSLEGGILVQPSLGFKLLSRDGAIGVFDIGYRIQRYDEIILGRDAPRKWTQKKIVFRIGVEF